MTMGYGENRGKPGLTMWVWLEVGMVRTEASRHDEVGMVRTGASSHNDVGMMRSRYGEIPNQIRHDEFDITQTRQ
ncbi:MAG: hypothetical protein ACI8VC_001135 [Candidatus Endobugula sp.]|jgi:hypothetical protein